MLRYQSRRHRILMDESEQALADAVHDERPRTARIAQDIIADNKVYSLWESRHAELVIPVAEQTRRATQIFKLRELDVRLVHRRALIRSIRDQGLKGDRRERVFKAFYGPRELRDAILTEHRHYRLAVSSRVATDHLIDIMQDKVSNSLLDEYETIYSRYFNLYCYIVSEDDILLADALRQEMAHLRTAALRMIKRIHSERPSSGPSDVENQAMLARSGRFPMRDYLIR